MTWELGQDGRGFDITNLTLVGKDDLLTSRTKRHLTLNRLLRFFGIYHWDVIHKKKIMDKRYVIIYILNPKIGT